MGSDIERSMTLGAITDLGLFLKDLHLNGTPISEDDMECIENLLTLIHIYVKERTCDWSKFIIE